jgi:RHH-type rel operon transcriptional repressor/antitoxin RelB
MAVSVRMDPMLERELELAAKRLGQTKSQFIINAVERALGRKDPYALYQQVMREMTDDPHYPQVTQVFANEPQEPYDTERSRAALIAKLRAKHGLSAD